MTKEAFLSELARRLAPLPEPERARTLEFYTDAIGDRVDAGKTEDEAVSELGDVAESDITVPAPVDAGDNAATSSTESGAASDTAATDATSTAAASSDAASAGSASSDTASSESAPNPGASYTGTAPGYVPPTGTVPPSGYTGSKRALPVWAIVLLIIGCPIWLSIGISLAAAVFSIVVAIFSVLLAFYMTVLGLVLGGLAAIVCSPFAFASGAAYGLLSLGGGLACVGVGILLLIGSIALTKLVIRGIRAVRAAIRRSRAARKANRAPVGASDGRI